MALDLRDEMYAVLSRVEEPDEVVAYLNYLKMQTKVWSHVFAVKESRK